MPKYQDIFDPEIIAKLKAKSSEKIRGKSLMQMMRSSQELLSLVVSIEAPYKSQLSQLAIDIVKDHYPTLVEDNIDVKAKIVSNVTLEEYNPYEKQRRISNAIVQGASVEELYSLFEKESVIQQIRSINPPLYDKYNELMKQVFGVYNDDQAINMMLAAIASGQNLSGGRSKIVTENEDPKIIAEALCFPMLVHEILKGYWSILAQTGLKGSDEEAQATVDRVDKLEYEPEDIRYGPIIFNKLKIIYKAFTPPDIDVRAFVVFYVSVLQLEPNEFFSFISNIVGDRPLSEDQIAWIEDKLERMQAYLRKKDTEKAMSSFSNNDGEDDNEDDDINIRESTKLTDIVKSIIQEESTQYRFEGLLQTDTIRRPQKDILSDIRALTGVTIVSTKDYDLSGESTAFSNPNYYSILKIKVDPHPFMSGGGFKDETLQTLLSDIRKIDGVKNFKLTQSVEKSIV